MRRIHVGPPVSPCTLLGLLRSCIPDGAPVREDELRSYLPDVDACLNEMRRADARRYEDEREAA